jgi:hypothetical protein
MVESTTERKLNKIETIAQLQRRISAGGSLIAGKGAVWQASCQQGMTGVVKPVILGDAMLM